MRQRSDAAAAANVLAHLAARLPPSLIDPVGWKPARQVRAASASVRAVVVPRLKREAHTHLVEMAEEVGRVLIDPVGAGTDEFIFAIAARQEADAKGAGAP